MSKYWSNKVPLHWKTVAVRKMSFFLGPSDEKCNFPIYSFIVKVAPRHQDQATLLRMILPCWHHCTKHGYGYFPKNFADEAGAADEPVMLWRGATLDPGSSAPWESAWWALAEGLCSSECWSSFLLLLRLIYFGPRVYYSPAGFVFAFVVEELAFQPASLA